MTVHQAAAVHGHPGADAIRTENGRITEIGTAAGMDGTRVSHGDGVILPALRDGHIHPLGLAAIPSRVDLADVRSIAEALDRLRAHASTRAGTIVAVGLDDETLEEHRLPTAVELDHAVGDRPVLVYRHCSHVAVGNTTALAAGGLHRHSPDPPGGRIGRRADGALSGTLEEAAIAPVATALSTTTAPPTADDVTAVLRRLLGRGVVAIDAMVATGSSMWCLGGDELGTLLDVAAETPLQIDVFVICDSPRELRDAARRLQAGGPTVRFGGWKGFADGSLGARTAALRSPYSDDPSTQGMTVGAGWDEMAETAVALGGQVAVHAIGDLAVERTLALAARLGPGTVRIEHASVADPAQVARMAEIGVACSVQPSFAVSDAPWIEDRLGPERVTWAYPFASLLAAGVELRGGSDAPIESFDPFDGIRDACLPRPEALHPAQAVDLYAASPLAVGTAATFLLSDASPVDVAVPEIARIEVREVWVGDNRVV